MAEERKDIPRMLRAPEVEKLTGLSSTSIWRLERRGEFPLRRKLMGSSVGWREDEVQEWIESRPPVDLAGESS